MARIDERAVVVHAGPVIHLDELGCLDLLEDFSPLATTEAVWNEVVHHRPALRVDRIAGLQIVAATGAESPQLLVMADCLGLAGGETSALLLAEQHGLQRFLTDDTAARLAGESLGLSVHGTIGVIVRSIRRGLRSRDAVVDILKTIRQRSTLHVSSEFLEQVISRVIAG